MTERRSHLLLVGLIVAALVAAAMLSLPGSPFHKGATLGLDLQGGTEVVQKAVPPNRSISCFTRAWYGRNRARTSSGSAFSDAAVNPTRSTKRTETILRSSALDRGASSIAVPQAQQNRARSGFSSPHLGQAGIHRV